MTSAKTVSQLQVFASCVGISSLAISQPILDLLGRNPEFFLARSSPTSDIILLAVLLAVVFPVALALLTIAIRRANLVAGTGVHLAVIVLLSQFLVVEIVERSTRAPSMLAVLLGIVSGIAVAYAFYSFAMLRAVLTVIGLAPVAILVSFLVLSPLSRLVYNNEALVGSSGVTVRNPVPIVMVVFDEFPLVSLIDGEGDLQRHNYPNIARLADAGVWFRNAVTNETSTERAIPSIMTGARADPDAIPIAAEYPGNLFSLLGGIYEIDAIEDLTDLCPDSACEESSDVRWQDRWARTMDDLSVVTQHVLLPEDLTANLPPIDQTWSGFRLLLQSDDATNTGGLDDAEFDLRERFHARLDEGRQDSLSEFLENLGSIGERPSFDFIHVLLPHSPWEYLPDGRRHGAPQPPRGSDGPGWGADPWLVHQIYQRHLLQVQYADKFIGQTIDRLEELGVYEESLIVVLADHGIAIAPGLEHRRRLNAETVGEMAAVPLFIKPPGGGTDAGVDDFRAELIDVAPTIADILEVDLPWQTDGVSLFADARPVRTETVINPGEYVIPADGEEKLRSAIRKVQIFGSGSPYDLAPPGLRGLLWQSIEDLEITPANSIRGEIANADRYETFDPNAETLPVNVQGILGGVGAGERVTVALDVNGTISAVTQSYIREGTVLIQAIVPVDAFDSGVNELSMILVVGSGGEVELSYIQAP